MRTHADHSTLSAAHKPVLLCLSPVDQSRGLHPTGVSPDWESF
jgi:hypothetical protein